MAEIKKVGGAQTFEKGLLTLEYIVENKTVSLTKLAKQMGINKSTLYRYLSTLKRLGYLSQDENDGYFLTDKLMKMAMGVVPQMEIRTIALEYLSALSSQTEFNSNLGFWNGKEILYLAQKRPHPIGSFMVGETIPAYCSALGKAILAFLPEEEIKEYISKTRFKTFTPQTTSSSQQLLAELAVVREQGYALMNGEMLTGLVGVAVPLFISGSTPKYALSLAGALYGDVRHFVSQCVPLLQTTARAIAGKVEQHNNMYA